MSGESKRAFTTGEVAKICGVNFRTVIRWIQRGQLKGYKLPGRGDHRVVVEDLLQFCEDNQIPVPMDLGNQAKRILIIEPDIALSHTMERLLSGQGYVIEKAKNAFIAGTLLHQFNPDLITLDLSLPGIGGLEVLKFIKQHPLFCRVKTIILSDPEGAHPENVLEHGADQCLPKPFRGDLFLGHVTALLT